MAKKSARKEITKINLKQAALEGFPTREPVKLPSVQGNPLIASRSATKYRLVTF